MILNATSLAVLSQTLQMRFNTGLARAVTPWNLIAMEVPSGGAENIYPYLVQMGAIREWLGDRVIQNLSKGEFRIANKQFEETHAVKRIHIEDDMYGIYGPMFEQTGQNVASFPSEQAFGMLKSGFTTLGPDGQYFFDVDHPVGDGVASNFMGGAGEGWYILDASKVFKPVIYQPRQSFDLKKLFNPTDPNVFFQDQLIWGVDGRAGFGFSPFWQLAFASKQTLDAAAVKATLTAMGVQKDRNGKPLAIRGTHIVVSPNLEQTAIDLFSKDLLSGGESNTLKGRLQVVVAPELL